MQGAGHPADRASPGTTGKERGKDEAGKETGVSGYLRSKIVEGEFGVGKRSYGLNRIMARLQETFFCVIGIALLCMNLAKRLRSLLHHFCKSGFFLLSAPFSHFRGLRSGL